MTGFQCCLKAIAAITTVTGLIVPVYAEEEEKRTPNQGNVTLSLGLDFTNAYYFRGIGQENQDLIVEPFGTVTFKLIESEGLLNNVSVFVGTWNSFHGGPTGTEDFGDFRQDPQAWYEADLYVGVSATIAEDWAASVTYTAYTSPNDSFATIQEIAVRLGYNDRKLWNDKVALNPYVLVAFEIDDQADFGNGVNVPPPADEVEGFDDTNEGIYLELGIAPSFTICESLTMPVTLTIPVVVGLSLDDYYESNVDGNDETFGYVSAGAILSVPLAFVPAKLGTWTLSAGVNIMFLGDSLEDLSEFNGTGGDSTVVIGKIGLAMSY